MDNGKKNTLRILSTNDIRNHARDWTLAGDVGLLAHLERFSESIITKTQETQANFNELVDDYEELHTKVGNTTNQFLALQNCQFVENRVYDEETPTEEKTELKVQDEADQEKLLLMQYKEAVEVGIKLLDTHFQEVQLPPNSDSDEEDEVSPGNSIIWKSKNPYAGKKFPFLIGSPEWWADDNVGLRPNKGGVDTEKIVSESESDMESPKSIEKTMKSSSSSSMENLKSIPIKPAFMESSEDLFGFNKNDIVKNMSDDVSKGSNSLPEEPTEFLPDFDKEPGIEIKKRGVSSDEYQTQKEVNEKSSQDEITTNKPKKVDNEFTRELLAKLVSVTNKTETVVVQEKEVVEEVRKEAVLPTKRRGEESLFDETDNANDLFSTKITKVTNVKKGSLFFGAENDDELFRGENDLFSGSSLFEDDVFKREGSQPVKKNNFGDRASEPKIPEKAAPVAVTHKNNLVNDLFDDLDDDEDTLFSARPVNQKAAEKSLATMESDGFKQSKPPAAPGLAWHYDEGLFDSVNTKLDDDFSSSALFDARAKRKEERVVVNELKSKEAKTDSLSECEIAIIDKEASVADAAVTKPVKGSDDPFGFSSSKDSGCKKISILDSEEEDDLFSKSFLEKKPSVRVTTLQDEDVDDDVDDDDDAALFGDKPKPADSVSVSSSRSSLFDDASASKSRLASVFEKDKPKSEENLSDVAGNVKSGRDLISAKGREEKSSLFDDCDDGDDLFSTGGTKSIIRKSEESIARRERRFADDFEDNDLFKTSATPTKLRNAKSDTFRHSEGSLFGNDSCDTDLFVGKPAAVKPKPPSSLSLKSGEAKGQTVGRLNIPDNLKVRFESIAKNISPGGGKPREKKSEEKEEVLEENRREEEEEVLDEPIQASALLKCPSKDRVKIPGRRRPQSRRARQAAFRNSGGWDHSLSSGSSTSQPVKDVIPSPAPSNPLSPSTDEEDFFKVPELDTNFEKEDQSIFKSDLFESSKTSKLEDNLLFDGAPVLSPVSPKKADEEPEEKKAESLFRGGPGRAKARSIFDDDEDEGGFNGEEEESLFKTSKPSSSETGKKAEEKVKKPLFDPDMDDDDDDDDDDLFAGKSHVTPSKVVGNVEKRKEGGEQKEKGNSSFVDPLGLITKNE